MAEIGKLDIYREGEVLATIDIDEGTVYNSKLQGTKSISCQTLSQVNIPIQKEDYIVWEGERYTINTIPEVGKDGALLSKDYKMVFEAAFYHLLDWFVNKDGAHTFPYYATAKDHLQMIIDCANSVSSGWVLGDVDDTEEFLINYDWHYIRTALDEIATAAKLEYEFTGKTLRMVASVGRDTGLVLKVGKSQGLHKIQRSPDTAKSSVNRVWGIGGTKNIDASYRGGLETNLVFEERYVQTPEVTAWLNGTGPEVRIKEVKYTNEERYPHFLGAITAAEIQRNTEGKIISATFFDPTINFDINSYLLPGVKGTVSFLSGTLTGVEFEISSFNFSTKTTTIIPNTDTNGYVLPNDLNFPEAGDKYTYLNIKMPAEYEANEEALLKSDSEQYLADNRYDRLLFGIEPDAHNLRLNQIRLKEGDRVQAVDTEMEVDEILRIVDISYPLVNVFKVTALIGNEIIYDKAVKPYADAIAIRKQIQYVDRRGAEIAKRNSQNLRQLADSIFDVDGNLDATKLNIGVLMAILAQFGLQSSDFLLNNVFIAANYGGDVNSVNISGGELIHMEYTHEDSNIWQMQPVTQSGLVSGTRYYVYSKISTTSNAGTFLITTDQIKPNDIPGFYTLRTGLIYPVNAGYRDADFTYGITSINGRQIRTGIIEGNTGALSLNLDTGDIFGKLTFRAANGLVTDVKTVNDTANAANANAGTALSNAAAAQNSANIAQANATSAQIAATTAQNEATAAIAKLAAIADDGILDVSEKVDIQKDVQIMNSEYATVIAQANSYGQNTDSYTDNVNNVNNYAETVWFLSNGQDTTINRTLFNNIWAGLFTSKTALLKLVSDRAKVIADTAQSSADSAYNTAVNAQAAANNAQTSANNAKAQAEAALTELADIADDGKFDPSEKVSELKNWRLIESELPTVQQQASAYGVSTADYVNKFTALGNYVTPLFANMNVSSDINRTEFINKFNDYYKARQAVYDAVANATKLLVDNISVGGVNMLQDSSFERGILQSGGNSQSVTQYSIGEASLTPAGNAVNGSKILFLGCFDIGGGDAFATLLNTFFATEVGKEYTVSYYSNYAGDLTSSSSYLQDGINYMLMPIAIGQPNRWVRNVFTFTAQRGGVDALRFGFFCTGNAWLAIDAIQVEAGNTATDWTASPADIQAQLEALQADSTAKANAAQTAAQSYALAQAQYQRTLAESYADGIITTEEQARINADLATLSSAQADATAKSNAAQAAAQQLAQLLANQNKDLINGKNYASGKMLNRDPEFASGFNGISVYNNTADGTVQVSRIALNGTPNGSGYALQVNPSTSASPNFGGFYFGTGSRSNAVFIVRIYAAGSPGQFINFGSNAYGDGGTFTWNTSNAFTGGWQEFIGTVKCGSSGAFSSTNFFSISGNANILYLAYASVFDMTGIETDPLKYADDKTLAAVQQANAFAETIATSKANIAQAAAIGAAQADAQSKADSAYSNAVAASNNYAATVANSSASAAQIAAAADASTKAYQAYLDASNYASNLVNTLTASLRDLAYQDFVELSKLGATVIDQGLIKTTLLNVQAIWANIINAGYITAQQIEALNIAVTNLQAVQGTIGGLTISNNSITSSNGNFGITSDGALTAKSGQIGGFSIGASELSAGNFVLNPSKNAAYFSENVNGAVVAAIGKPNAIIPNVNYTAPGIFVNELNQSVGENVALVASAKGASLRNIAIDIPNGQIRMGGQMGYNGTIYNSNNQALTVRNGIIIPYQG